MSNNPATVWAAIILLTAVAVGSLGTVLAIAGDILVPLALLVGASGFAGTVLLCLSLAHFLAREKS